MKPIPSNDVTEKGLHFYQVPSFRFYTMRIHFYVSEKHEAIEDILDRERNLVDGIYSVLSKYDLLLLVLVIRSIPDLGEVQAHQATTPEPWGSSIRS